MRMVTDSTPVGAPKDPDRCALFALYALFAPEAEREEMARRYREGGVGYGEVKKETVRLFFERLGPIRERRRELAGRPDYVRDVLRDGARRAREKARVVTERVREACGVPRP